MHGFPAFNTSTGRPRAYWLSMHVAYACRDSGACCSAGWPIPLEEVRRPAIARSIGQGALAVPRAWLHVVPDQPPEMAGVLAKRDDRHCVFHTGAACRIHGALGADALPAACQHFPRRCLLDARGVFVTLSHYCPTAANLVFEHQGPVAIVPGPPVGGGEPEGLDARDALPPLLTSGVLTDLEGYAAWEAHMVRLLTGGEAAEPPEPDVTLQALSEHARVLAGWRPGARSLCDAVLALETEPAPSFVHTSPDWARERVLFERARASAAAWPGYPIDSVADAWTRWVAPEWLSFSAVIGRFLAAHAFANWTAYQGRGLPSTVEWLHVVLAVLRAEAIRGCTREGGALTRARLIDAVRQTDLLLVHLADQSVMSREF
ncbi:MAG: hypothetical protein ACT4QD_08875 [Acidobacteriota bacterium]